MAGLQDILKEASESCKQVLETLVLTHVKLSITEVLVPTLQDALTSAMEEVKGGDSKEVEVKMDKIIFDRKETQPDYFKTQEEDCGPASSEFGNPWTEYHVFSIRVGSDKESGRFYLRGYEDWLRYTHLQALHNKIKEEFKEVKTDKQFPTLPADEQWGYKCGCIYKSGNPQSQNTLMSRYLEHVQEKPWANSKEAAKFFSLGDDYEQQARLRKISKIALLRAAEEFLGHRPWWYQFRHPFDDTDGVRQLLMLVLNHKILPRLRSAVTPPVCAAQALRAQEEVLWTSINATAAGWNAAQDTINKVKSELIATLEKESAKLAEGLKPIMAKIWGKLQEKMKPKEEKKESDEEKNAIGSYVARWRFEKTPQGQRWTKLVEGESAAKALADLKSELDPRNVIENSMKTFAESLASSGYSFMANPIVADVIHYLARDLGWYVNRFNTVNATLGAAEALFAARDHTEAHLLGLEGKSAEDAEKVIEEVSAALWVSIADSGIAMFQRFRRIHSETEERLRRDGTPDEAQKEILDCINELFQINGRTLNAIRVGYVHALREGLKDNLSSKDSIKAFARKAFNDASYSAINASSEEQWVRVSQALIVYGQQTAIAKVMKEVWPSIEDALGELKAILPGPIAERNIHVMLVEKVLEIIISTVVGKGMKKLIPIIEKHLWEQKESE